MREIKGERREKYFPLLWPDPCHTRYARRFGDTHASDHNAPNHVEANVGPVVVRQPGENREQTPDLNYQKDRKIILLLSNEGGYSYRCNCSVAAKQRYGNVVREGRETFSSG